MSERTVRPHEFWLATCDVDTYRRGPNYARQDTPWNAFTRDESALVCTLWIDQIVDVWDATENRNRRFVKLGGKSRAWKGLAVAHGKEARGNLEKAIELRRPVFGFEAEPDAGALQRGIRTVKYFYLDRAHQLKGWIGLSKSNLEDRLQIEDAFKKKGVHGDIDPNQPATLFELVDLTADIPGARLVELPQDASGVDDHDQGSAGNLSADEYALIALPLLVSHVLRQKDGVLVPMTYLGMAELLGRKNRHGDPWARGLGKVLGRVANLIESASQRWPEQPPVLTSIVVLTAGTDAGLPDDGIGTHWPGYESLSREDKAAKVDAEYRRILAFGSRWNEILRLAGLEPVPLPPPPTSGGHGRGGGSVNESEAHIALKQHVLAHPELVGAREGWFAQVEYALRSGDEVDVMFKSDKLWIGVEVKSRTSDGFPRDYERGLYQVVKYKAVLEAQANVDHPDDPPEVRVLLALETRLPELYRRLATKLQVTYLEGLSSSIEVA